MITSVAIKNLRGIREGKLEGLTPLTVLVGPNSAGKSTILDALLIGASPSMAQAVGATVRRRQGVQRGARWLFFRGGDHGGASVTVRNHVGDVRAVAIATQQSTPSMTVLACKATPQGAHSNEAVSINPDNTFHANNPAATVGPLRGVAEIRLVEPHGSAQSTPMHDLYSRAVQRGRRLDLKELVGAIVPGLEAIEILTEEGAPVVHLVFTDHSVPVGLLGDGIQSLLRQAFELASRPGSVVLLEEPEVHEHPSAVWQTAQAIVAAVARDAQVILTTHSLDLIDALVSQLGPNRLDALSLYRVMLQDGVLVSSRLDGPQVRFARSDIEDDLR